MPLAADATMFVVVRWFEDPYSDVLLFISWHAALWSLVVDNEYCFTLIWRPN
jgi:hypothetical protein